MATPAPVRVAAFFAAWLTDELSIHLLVADVAVTGLLVWKGGLATPMGQVGLALSCLSWVGFALLIHRAGAARAAMEQALSGHATFDSELPTLHLVVPFPVRRFGVTKTGNLPFHGEGRAVLRLDVHRTEGPASRRPVLIYVHGGAWVIGQRQYQGLPLMQHLASRGWVCFSIDYRLSPRATFPDHVVDVKRAIAWVKAHAAEYGGDPSFVALSGNSAGGHLAALAALTPDDAAFQPGFEDADTHVQACVPFYGIYDFVDRHRHWPDGGMRVFLERLVMKVTLKEARAAFDAASPIARVHAEAPPFLVVHGTGDSLVPVAEARRFFEALGAVSKASVAYAEIPGAQHAFEVFPSRRTAAVVAGATAFLESEVRKQRAETGHA